MTSADVRLNPHTLDAIGRGRTKRILYLVTDAFGGYGGIALYNRDFLEALCSYGDALEVVALPRVVSDTMQALPHRLTYDTSGLGGKGRYAKAVLRRLWCDTRFDLIVCAHINLLPLAFLASRLSRAPLVMLLYGIEAWSPTPSALSNYLVRKVMSDAAISEVTQRRYRSWARTRAKGYILPNAIRLEDYAMGAPDPNLERAYGLEGRTVLMTLGRLVAVERQKGFDEVVDVLPQLAKDIPDVLYLIVGEGPDRARLEQRAREKGVGDRVVFTGFVPEEQKAALYRSADAYVMPSRGEGFGFVVLEALATGVPAVGSTLDGTREALRDGMLGSLVDPGDANALRAAIAEAVRKPKQIPIGLEYFSFANFEKRVHVMLADWLSVTRSSR